MAVDTKARVFLASKRERGEDPQKVSAAGGAEDGGRAVRSAAHRGEAVRGEARTPTAAPPTERGRSRKKVYYEIS